MSTVKALLFDLGGVILTVDFKKVFHSWSKLSSLSEQEIHDRFTFDECYEQHERGLIDAATFFDHQRHSLQLKGSDNELIAGWNAIFDTQIIESMDAIDAIRTRLPTYGFTNTNQTHQLYWEENFPRARGLFKTLFVSSEIGMRKPDKEAFEHILNDIGVQAEELLFFDDSPENIEGAKRLGIQTVLVTGSDSVVAALKRI